MAGNGGRFVEDGAKEKGTVMQSMIIDFWISASRYFFRAKFGQVCYNIAIGLFDRTGKQGYKNKREKR